MEKKIEHYDVVIIGGGAAGMTAGIYCGRARLKTLIIEKALVGGLATYTNEIENYPGFPEGSTGLGLMELFHKQAKKFGVQFKLTDVRAVRLEGEDKIVETFRNEFHSKVVIIASGGKPRLTGAPGEDKYLYDKGISFCATCDAAANTGKTVMVIGSGRRGHRGRHVPDQVCRPGDRIRAARRGRHGLQRDRQGRSHAQREDVVQVEHHRGRVQG